MLSDGNSAVSAQTGARVRRSFSSAREAPVALDSNSRQAARRAGWSFVMTGSAHVDLIKRQRAHYFQLASAYPSSGIPVLVPLAPYRMTHPHNDDTRALADNAFDRLQSLPDQVIHARQHPAAVLNTLHVVPGALGMSDYLVALVRERRN